jgi:hypothetical protein
MPRDFPATTAEYMVSVVEATTAFSDAVSCAKVAEFAEMRDSDTENALLLATDIGLLVETSGTYMVQNPVARALATGDGTAKAGAVRIMLEGFKPFLVFRDRLHTNGDSSRAAHETMVLLNLNGHKDDIKDTLVSLGTYARALETSGGGKYTVLDSTLTESIRGVTIAVTNEAIGSAWVNERLGVDFADKLDRDSVLTPLSNAALESSRGNSRAAIVNAGNAVESFLLWLGKEKGMNLAPTIGINKRLEELQSAGHIAKKIVFLGKYLGHLRNAADHGIDQDTQRAWDFEDEAGSYYTHVAIQFMLTAKGYSLDSKCSF